MDMLPLMRSLSMGRAVTPSRSEFSLMVVMLREVSLPTAGPISVIEPFGYRVHSGGRTPAVAAQSERAARKKLPALPVEPPGRYISAMSVEALKSAILRFVYR